MADDAVQLYGNAAKAVKRKNKAPPKPNAITRQRMYVVMQLMGQFIPPAMMVKKLMAEWNASQSVVERVIRLVHEEWADATSSPSFVSDRRNQLRQGWQVLFMKSQAAGELKMMGVCLKEMGLLDGCYADTKIDADGTFTGLGMGLGTLGYNSPGAVRERIDELQGRLTKMGPMGLAEFAKAQAQLQSQGQVGKVIDMEDDQGEE